MNPIHLSKQATKDILYIKNKTLNILQNYGI